MNYRIQLTCIIAIAGSFLSVSGASATDPCFTACGQPKFHPLALLNYYETRLSYHRYGAWPKINCIGPSPFCPCGHHPHTQVYGNSGKGHPRAGCNCVNPFPASNYPPPEMFTPKGHLSIPNAPSAIGDASQVQNRLLLQVSVPENAKVFINDYETSSSGAVREFATAPSQVGGAQVLAVRVSLVENGQELQEQKVVRVEPGVVKTIAFDFGQTTVR